MADRVGQQLGNYRILRLIGHGGFADVYLGEHIYLKTQVAVKVLQMRLMNEDIEGFLKEARTIAHLVHPHIVRVMDFGIQGETPFLVMDYAANGTLRQRHPKGTTVPQATIAVYVKQIAAALQHAHNEKLIHRDVKPENVLLGRYNEILLSDFGIALIAQSSQYQSTQDVVGTVAYMAPEQIQGKPRPQSDQYALGIVVYEWLSGDRPFHGSFTELCVQHMFASPPPLSEKVSGISPHLEQVVLTALQKDPRRRFATVQAFATALEQACQLPPDHQGAPHLQAPLPGEPSLSKGGMATLSSSQPPSSPANVVTPSGQSSRPTEAIASSSHSLQPPVDVTPLRVPPAASPPLPVGPSTTAHGQRPPLPINQTTASTLPPTGKRNPNFRLMVPILFLLVALIGSGIFFFARNSSNLGSGPGGSTTSNGNGNTSTSNTGAPAPTGSTTIKIATDFPVSGADENNGKPAENGAHLAVDQANANHTIPGYTLIFDPKDDVGPSGVHDPAVGAQNVTALVGDALVAGIVGPFNSSVAKAEMPITNQAPLTLISPANTNACLTQEGADAGCSGANDLVPAVRPTGKVNYFRIATTDNHQGPAGADYLYKTKGYKSVYVIDDAETYGVMIANTFSKEWQSLGGTLLGHSSEPATTTSYVSLLTQIAAKHPDVIYFGGLDSTGGILIRQQMSQIAALQNTPMAGGDGIVTPTFASTIGSPSAPIFGTVAVIDTSKSPAAQTFVSQYSAVYSTINVYSAAAYDCANILIQAIKTALANGAHTPQNSSDAAGAKAFRQAVINAIQNISYTGVTGHQAFDANGDTTNRIISIYQVAANTSGKPDWIFQDQVTVS